MLDKTLEEIREIPEYARRCLEKNKDVKLPERVPYLGMGASYNAILSSYYAGAPISPQMASEYYQYVARQTLPMGVIVSQSGKSGDILQSRVCFTEFVAITNDPQSPMATATNCSKIVELHAGDETSIASKTYVNTLITLYQAFGIDVSPALTIMEKSMEQYESWGTSRAKDIQDFLQRTRFNGFYLIGSGPNYATARQAALSLSESAKLGASGMSIAEYDHGPKETAPGTVVLAIETVGSARNRLDEIVAKLESQENCLIIRTPTVPVEDMLSPFLVVVMCNFLAYALATHRGVKDIYNLGGKVVA